MQEKIVRPTREEIRQYACPRPGCGAQPGQLCERPPAQHGVNHRERQQVADEEERKVRETTASDFWTSPTTQQIEYAKVLIRKLRGAGRSIPAPPKKSTRHTVSIWLGQLESAAGAKGASPARASQTRPRETSSVPIDMETMKLLDGLELAP